MARRDDDPIEEFRAEDVTRKFMRMYKQEVDKAKSKRAKIKENIDRILEEIDEIKAREKDNKFPEKRLSFWRRLKRRFRL